MNLYIDGNFDNIANLGTQIRQCATNFSPVVTLLSSPTPPTSESSAVVFPPIRTVDPGGSHGRRVRVRGKGSSVVWSHGMIPGNTTPSLCFLCWFFGNLSRSIWVLGSIIRWSRVLSFVLICSRHDLLLPLFSFTWFLSFS